VVEIDGIKKEVAKDAVLLDVIRDAGIWIPSLCAHGALEHYDACRLCLVEVEARGRTRIVTSCSYPIRSDCVVRADSETAVRARRGMMELLLARAPESLDLRALAEKMGVEKTRYPTVTQAQRNCILCGLCTRACAEVIGAAAISFASRGVNRAVAAPFHAVAEDCVGCGACARICPVGTIQLRYHEDTSEIEVSPFKARNPLRRCVDCGVPVAAEAFAARVESAASKAPDAASICDRCKRKRFAEARTKVRAFVPVGAAAPR
jgi:NADH dehydrogenase/NADH:ubiquinone oxidoreductase subunit G